MRQVSLINDIKRTEIPDDCIKWSIGEQLCKGKGCWFQKGIDVGGVEVCPICSPWTKKKS